MSNRNEARQLAKALNEIKATPFQIKAAATLLVLNGLQSALDFVKDMDRLNKMRESGELYDPPPS